MSQQVLLKTLCSVRRWCAIYYVFVFSFWLVCDDMCDERRFQLWYWTYYVRHGTKKRGSNKHRKQGSMYVPILSPLISLDGSSYEVREMMGSIFFFWLEVLIQPRARRAKLAPPPIFFEQPAHNILQAHNGGAITLWYTVKRVTLCSNNISKIAYRLISMCWIHWWSLFCYWSFSRSGISKKFHCSKACQHAIVTVVHWKKGHPCCFC